MKLVDKIAVVTGGGRGIGKEIALALAREGADVVVSGRQRDVLEKTAAEIQALGRRAVVALADVTSESQVSEMFDSAIQAFGRVDILVNNAGIAGPTAPVTNLSREDWDEVLAVNLTGAFLCARAVIPQMVERRSGKIINISSVAGKMAYALRSPYSASKWGMLGLSASLAQELGPHNIQVNAICPGFFPSKMTNTMLGATGKIVLEGTPTGRLGNEEDLKGLAVLLASEASRHITGQAIAVDGGASVI